MEAMDTNSNVETSCEELANLHIEIMHANDYWEYFNLCIAYELEYAVDNSDNSDYEHCKFFKEMKDAYLFLSEYDGCEDCADFDDRRTGAYLHTVIIAERNGKTPCNADEEEEFKSELEAINNDFEFNDELNAYVSTAHPVYSNVVIYPN